jgi:hypothetical protein
VGRISELYIITDFPGDTQLFAALAQTLPWLTSVHGSQITVKLNYNIIT